MKFVINNGTKEKPYLELVNLENLKIFYNPHTNLYDIKGVVKYDFHCDEYVKLSSYSSIDLCNKFIGYTFACIESSNNYIIYVPTEEELNVIEFKLSYKIDKNVITLFEF